ncbi:MAG: PIN domain-containing protein [Nanoarchaeota archaeon]
MGRNSNNDPKKNTERVIYYYDACTLDAEVSINQILNLHHNHGANALTSHLAIGEAISNVYHKEKKDPIKAVGEYFNLIESLKQQEKLEVCGNDDVEKVFNDIKTTFPDLSFTDAIHLATAIKNKCQQLHTLDPDLYQLDHKKLKDLAERHCCYTFNVCDVRTRKKQC